MSIASVLRTGHLKSWDEENFVWPGTCAVASVVIYTSAHMVATQWSLSELRVVGEPAGAGGALVSVVMIAATGSKLTEWRKLIVVFEQGKYLQTEAPELCNQLNEIGQTTLHIMMFGVSFLLAIAFAGIHVQSVSQGASHFALDIVMLLGNLLFVMAVRQYCRSNICQAKHLLAKLYILATPKTRVNPESNADQTNVTVSVEAH